MTMMLFATAGLGLGALLALGTPAERPAPVQVNSRAAVRSTADTTSALAKRLTGTWKGHGTDANASQAQPLTMKWKADSDGTMTGTIMPKGEPSYDVNVVWKSDTAFIYESAPHQSKSLDEPVVTRTLAQFKGDSLVGTYEMRPAHKDKPQSLKGRFALTKQGK
ncbi:MAG TPA: hypothetical protein VFW66_02350 [Gemmatimonadales bacterium]|nr:hypothetical protein [Gemmatimonadales bacterium]